MKTPLRRGKSLIELLVVISIMSVVLGLCATSLATLFRLRHQLSRDRQQAAALARLATRLRQDAHSATDFSLDSACLLTLPAGEAVHYTYAPPHILREHRRGVQLLHRDRFTLPTSATAAFEQEAGSPHPLLRLTIRPAEVSTRRTEIPRAVTIEAAVGLTANLSATRRLP
jgi:prepilin-type N-terminal cleavage/methylation domain-containing protein